SPDDLLITLGDYVDRGPDSRGVLERLITLRSTNKLVALRGNHDQMMIDARRGEEEESIWRLCGGQQTLESYAPPSEAGKLCHVPQAHWDFLEKYCQSYYETDTHFFVHANAYADLPLDQQPDFMLFWERITDPDPHESGKIMVCGHTSQESGMPLHLGHTICIDTKAYGKGWLSCLDAVSGKLWQANQQGQLRTAHIDDYAVGS
ncbi:MAG TPA: metallophosphoesterase, partial [Gemmataceae bacterium]|nr:metallophosphoesterase [Gemmataceae bacterium]